MSLEITRRSFLSILGGAAGGLALGLRFGGEGMAEAAEAGGSGFAPNAFVQIGTDGVVTIVCHRSEMGQGIRSSLPVVVADELGADWSSVRVVQGDGDKRYGDQNTDGSSSVREFFHDMRVAGATARTMLIAAAAQRWKVPESGLTAHDHAVHDGGGRSLGFGELALAAAALPVSAAESVSCATWARRCRSSTRRLM